jgi:uncharacterized protein (TIGR03000 family)
MYRLIGIVSTSLLLVGLAAVLEAQQDPPKAPPGKALVIVRVPADAVVTIDDRPTKEKGTERKFITPVLIPGATYAFEIVARWKEMDKEQSEKRTIYFEAGQVKTVDFIKGTQVAKKAEPEKKTEIAKKEPEKKIEPEKKKEPEKKAAPATKKEPLTKTEPAKKKEPLTKTEPEKKEPRKKVEPETKKEPEKKAAPETKKEPEKKAAPETKKEPEKKGEPMPPRSARTRTFYFKYAARIKDLQPGTRARIWIPIATSNPQQEVTIVEPILAECKMDHDPVYGNTIACFEGKARNDGTIPFDLTYKVRRKEILTDAAHGVLVPAAAGEALLRYVQGNARVPVAGKPLAFLKQHIKDTPLPSEPVTAARFMFDVVHKHLAYKPTAAGAGQGDAAWACENGYGSSVDLDSVFMAMARSQRIPAKFEVGFTVPAKLGPVADVHSWAWFSPNGKGWVPVDFAAGTFGSLDENRVSFSVGRDIALVPRPSGGPVNFFIDPYVEVNGKAYPQSKIQRRHSLTTAP